MPILSNPFIGSFRSPYGDVVSGHNRLRDALFEPCRQAGVGGQTEVGSGLGHDERRTWPADVLVPNWDLGKPAAFDLTVTSPLNSILKRVRQLDHQPRLLNKENMLPMMPNAQS